MRLLRFCGLLGLGCQRPAGVGAEPSCPAGFASLTAATAVVIDRADGSVLLACDAALPRAMASTTKIMTALLVVEAIEAGTLSLEDTVEVGPEADWRAVGGSSIGGDPEDDPDDRGLVQGDRIGLEDLLFGLMLASGNDAAAALASHHAGDLPTFVARMNARAEELGLEQTHVGNPHGRDLEDLPDTHPECADAAPTDPGCAHHASALDLAALADVALERPLFATLVSTVHGSASSWVDAEGQPVGVSFCNSNRLLRSPEDDCGTAHAYPGVYGVKTGTTDQAGSCLVAAATSGSRDVIAVVLGAAANGSPGGDRYSDTTQLLDCALTSCNW